MIKLVGVVKNETRMSDYYFNKLLEGIERNLDLTNNVRTEKEIVELTERILFKRLDGCDIQKIENIYSSNSNEILEDSKFIVSTINLCLPKETEGLFLMWWNRTGEYKDSETAKFGNEIVVLSDEDQAEYNMGNL